MTVSLSVTLTSCGPSDSCLKIGTAEQIRFAPIKNYRKDELCVSKNADRFENLKSTTHIEF